MELKEKVTAMKEEERWVCLMHDEMSIKQDLVSIFCWCIYKAVNFEMKYFPAKNIHAICGFESTGIQQPQWRTNRVCFQWTQNSNPCVSFHGQVHYRHLKVPIGILRHSISHSVNVVPSLLASGVPFGSHLWLEGCDRLISNSLVTHYRFAFLFSFILRFISCTNSLLTLLFAVWSFWCQLS